MSRAPRCPVWILLDSNICCQKLKMTFIKWRVSVYVKIVSLIRNKNDYFPARSAWRLRKLISLWDTFNFHDVLLSYYWDFDTLTYNRSNLLKTQSNIWNTNDSAAQQCPINGGLEIIIQHSETCDWSVLNSAEKSNGYKRTAHRFIKWLNNNHKF